MHVVGNVHAEQSLSPSHRLHFLGHALDRADPGSRVRYVAGDLHAEDSLFPSHRLHLAGHAGNCPAVGARGGNVVGNIHPQISLPTQGFVAATLVLVRSRGVRGGLPEELGHGGEVLVLELSHVFVASLNLCSRRTLLEVCRSKCHSSESVQVRCGLLALVFPPTRGEERAPEVPRVRRRLRRCNVGAEDDDGGRHDHQAEGGRPRCGISIASVLVCHFSAGLL